MTWVRQPSSIERKDCQWANFWGCYLALVRELRWFIDKMFFLGQRSCFIVEGFNPTAVVSFIHCMVHNVSLWFVSHRWLLIEEGACTGRLSYNLIASITILLASMVLFSVRTTSYSIAVATRVTTSRDFVKTTFLIWFSCGKFWEQHRLEGTPPGWAMMRELWHQLFQLHAIGGDGAAPYESLWLTRSNASQVVSQTCWNDTMLRYFTRFALITCWDAAL